MTKSAHACPIEALEVSAYRIPTETPESDGTLEWQATTLVVVELQAQGLTGLGYTYADAATARLIESTLGPVVKNQDFMAIPKIGNLMRQAVRNLGRPGVASMAMAAVDIALWDLKARALGLPLFRLLGAARPSIPAYGSGGFTSYSREQLQNQLRGWIHEGLTRVKIKVGRHPADDRARVEAAREAIGPEASLFVDANGAYSVKEALRHAQAFAELGVNWFEEPVVADDLEGLKFIRERAPGAMEIAAGEYGYDSFYFRRMLEAQAVDVLQIDASRCAGVSGFMQAASLCESRNLLLSAHTSPSLHAHLCCAVNNAVHVEYFFDHARIEHLLFEGALGPVGGELFPSFERAGLGLNFRKGEAQRYALTP